MHRMEHNRYDVEAWTNRHDEIEIKVYDHKRWKAIAHLVLREPEEITEDGHYLSLFVESQQRLREGGDPGVRIKSFVDIDRTAGEYAENTLYWELSSDGFSWSRHPLDSWESMVASGEFFEAEVLYGEDALEVAFEELRKEYMEDCAENVAKIMP